MKILSAILTASLIALLWFLFAPREVGGWVSYVVVTGDSMEPGLHSGDLAIVRSASSYEIGDVVIYHHPELGVVIHRIVGAEDGRFLVQGDSNDWVDSHQPVESEITGKLWLGIPSAGRFLNLLRQPMALALLSLVVGFFIMLPGRKNKQAKSVAVPGVLPSLAEPRGRDLLSLLAVLAVGALLLAGLAFTRSPERQATREIPYGHHGAFDYSAAAPDGIYDADAVTSGEPIFRELIDAFDVTFDYTFDAEGPLEAGGTAALHAELSADNGWKRTFELQPETSFVGTTTTLHGVIDLNELQRIIDRVEAETGVAVRQYKLAIKPEIALEAGVGEQIVHEQFAPVIAFQMDTQQLQLIRSSSLDEGLLEQSAGGLATRRVVEANTLSLTIIELDVDTARQISVVALALIGLAVAALALGTLRMRSRSEAERMLALYHHRIVSVRPDAAPATGEAIEADSFDDFQRLLEHHQGPIFKDGPVYFIDHEGQRFQLRTNPSSNPVGVEDANQPMTQQPSRPRHAIGQLLVQRRQWMKQA